MSIPFTQAIAAPSGHPRPDIFGIRPDVNRKPWTPIFAVVLLTLMAALPVSATIKVWVGGNGPGGANGWASGGNWSSGTTPTSTDTIRFDNTSANGCLVNSPVVTVAAIIMTSGYTATFDLNTRTLAIAGALGDFRTGGAFSVTTGKVSFTGTSAQTFIPAPVTMPPIEQNGTGGTTITTNNLTTSSIILANLASNGALNLGSGLTHTVTTTLTLNANGNLDFGSSTLAFGGTAADFTNLTTLTASSGTLRFSATSGTQVFTPKSGGTHPNITHTAAGTLQLATSDLTALSFSNSAGILDFNGRNITTSTGDFTVTNGTTTTFTNLAGRTITVGGNASLAGQNGNLLNLNPGATGWTLTGTASSTVAASYATISYGTVNPSTITGSTANCTDGGNNTRWAFVSTSTWDGGGGDYNWNTAANWSPDGVPSSVSLVVFNGTSTKKVVLNVNATVYSIQFTSGYASTDGNTGNFDFSTNTLTVETGSADFTMGSSATITPGTGNLTFSATSGTQTFTPRSGATYPAITKSGAGTVMVATNALTAGALADNGGTWDWGASTLTHAVTAISTSGSSTMTFGTNTVQVTSGSADFTGLTTLNANTGTLTFTGTSGTQILTPKASATHPSISHTGASTLQLSTNALSCLSFSQSAGVLDFNSRDITTTGTGNFTLTNGTTTTLTGLAGRTITVGGNASLSGQSGNLLNLNPGASGWTLTATASSTVTANFATLSYGTVNPSTITGTATNSTNGGNNVRWTFINPVTWDGGGSDGTCGGGAGDGNKWSCAANWDGNVAPTSSDTVIFNATSTKDCKLDASVTVNAISLASGYTGTFDFQSYTLSVAATGDFRTGGAITPGTGKIAFTGSSPQTLFPPALQASSTLPAIEQNGTGGTTVSTNRLRTSALILANLASNGAFNLGAGLTDTVTTTLTLNANGSLNFGSSTLVFEGSAADFSSLTTLTAGSGTLSFPGGFGNNVTFTPKSGATFPAISKPNANTVTVATSGLTAGALSVAGGTWNWGSSSLTHAVSSIAISNTATMTFGTNTVQVTSGNCDFNSSVINANTGTLSFTAASGTQVFTPKSATSHPTVTHTGAGTLQLSTNDLSTLGFSQSAGILDFNGKNITTTSSGNFTLTNGTSTSFTNLGGRTLTVAGNASFSGSASGTANLNPGSTWTLNVTGTLSAAYARVGNSDASGSLSTGEASNSENMGSNTNWSFLLNEFLPWTYSTRISFNTTSTGANVSGNVANFPFLVRLDSNNFIFNQAKPDGSDIRFADPDGTTLAYEIERWDATGKKAAIWVKVPQVDGNSSSDFIKMYWGNNSATSLSAGSGVFATTTGYVAAWHLAESPGASAPQFTDASGLANHGTAQAGATGDSITAVSGKGFKLNGSTKFISSTTSYYNQDVLTIGTWFKTTTTSGGRLVGWETSQTGSGPQKDRIIYMGDDGKVNFAIYDAGNRVITSTAAYNDGGWHHVAGTVSASGMVFYVDGVSVGSNAYANPEETTGWWRAGFGSHSGWVNAPTSDYFNGSLDEVFMAHSAFSADFVKLAYQSQRTNTTAISFPNTALSTFAYSTKVYINTSSSGAATAADVTNFPLLVRLTNANFNFTQAKSDGGDIRFADSSGALLAYEVERFDATRKLAEFWVRIPTVKGNNNSQWFRMYWGKGTATSIADNQSVWNAYKLVYHLGESPGASAPQFTDKSGNGNDGTAQAGAAGDSLTANIGKGFTLNGSTKYISSTRSFVNPGTFTIGTWFKTTTVTGGFIIGFGDAQTGGSGSHDRFIWMDNTGKVSLAVNPGFVGYTVTSASAYNDGAWHHAAGRTSSAGLFLYVDGVLVGVNTSGIGGESYTGYWRAGYDNTGWSPIPTSNYFNGSLDEMWAAHGELSVDYIKLAYQTQKSTSTVVQIGNRSHDYTNSVRLHFNTTATGANVTGNVTDIPILVRATSSMLDFSKTTATGSDIQFVDKDGTYLHHQVVEWDKGNKTGKVWVKVPQVDGNSTSDFITLYYGCSTCTGTPYAVADSVWRAYRGVWPLNVANENQAKDVTAYRNHLSYTNSVPFSTGLTAPLSPYFSGNTARVSDPAGGDLDMGTGDFTMMGWVKTTYVPATGVWPVLFGKTNPSVTPRYGIGVVMNEGGVNAGKFFVEIFSNGTQKATPFSSTLINDGNWHFVVGRRTSGTLESFADGVSMGTVASAGADVSNPESFVLASGSDENAGNLFQGNLNHVTLSATSFSADYIKLSYQNQKSTDALLSTPITLSTSSFQNSKVYKFNTTASGANISGDVYNFPLLIRIAGTAICDAVQANAPDIRFLDADGVTWLDYQVARWNQTLDSAEVWVKVPKVDGNSAGDFITLYYKQAAGVTIPDGQCASCVFDVNNGYAGVWHLDNSLSDATGNAITGTNTGSTDAAGVVASGRNFDGTNDYISFGNSNALKNISGGITVEAWIRTATSAASTLTSVIRHDGHYTALQYTSDASGNARTVRWIPGSTSGSWTWNGSFDNDAWHHFAIHYDGHGNTKVWKDGAVHSSLTGSGGPLATNGTANFMLGATESGTEDWTGKLDEVRVSGVVRDSNYIKLSYQTQRTDATPLFNPSTAEFASTRKYIFNTTRTGANVMGDVENFPLLVRITGSTIVDAVQNDWDDIRFLDGDGKTWLQYQVERWDKANDVADVWVLVPKVDGNSDHDFITLYYNDVTDGAVVNGQCGTCAFPTSNGFAGVWHLGENPNGDAAAAMKDQTSNLRHGTPGGAMTTADSVAGIAGGAIDFDGSDDVIVTADIDYGTNNVFSASAWIKTSAALQPGNGNLGYVLSKDQLTGSSPYTLYLTSTNQARASINGANASSSGLALADGNWHHLFMTYDGTTMKLFADGVFRASNTATPLANDEKFAIGSSEATPTYRPFLGVVDEVVASQSVRDSNWIRLSFETQRPTGNLFWNTRPGPNNNTTLSATAGTTSISLAWTLPVSDSANADSVGIWLKYSGRPDSVGATGQTKVVLLPKTDSTYTYPALYPATYYFALAVRNASGQWSPFTASSIDTATLSMNYSLPDTVYVDSAIGSDANSCTAARNPSTPKLTLVSAVGCEYNSVNDSLVIRVMPGTYTDNNIDPNSKPVVISSFDIKSRAILNGSGSLSDGSTRNYTLCLRNDVTLRGMDLKCATNNNIGVYIFSVDPRSRVEGCRIYNSGSLKHDVGIQWVGNANNTIHIANNLIHEPSSYGILITADNSYNIVSNVLIGNGNAGTRGIYHNASAGGYTDMTLANNILQNWDYGITTVSANIGVCSNNLFHLVTSGREVTGTSDANKILKDPRFYTTSVSSPHAFKTLPGSPAIDGGTLSYATGGEAPAYRSPVDHFGSSRIQGTAPDIGLYEGPGHAPGLSGEFDTLITASSGNTRIVRNSKWKLVWDMARGAGITGFYDMADSTTNLLASNSLLFDVKIDAYQASAQTGNTLAPTFVERTKTRVLVRQRLGVSGSLDLNVWYTVYASGHVYVQSELTNVSAGTTAMGTLDYTLKVGTATAASVSGGAGSKNGHGVLSTASRDAFLSVTQDLDGNGAFSETWTQSAASGAGGTVVFNTADLADLAQNMKRQHHFLLYVGDGALDAGKAATLSADAWNPSPVSLSAGSLLHERSWQDGLVGHWTLDDGGGTSAKDKSLNYTSHATLTSTNWVSGKVGGALRFTTSSVATVSDATQLEAIGGRTYMLWVKPDFAAMGADAFLLSKGLTTSDGWHFRRVNASSQIKFVMGGVSVSTPTLTSGVWVHLAATVNLNHVLNLYVNGVLVAASSGATTPTANADNLLIGKSGADANAFAGDIDDVRLYQVIPSVGQLQAIAQRGFSQQNGLYILRADNNNRVVALLNETVAQTRVQPAFEIDNWFSTKTPKYVYLNGSRLIPNVDYVVDSLSAGIYGGVLYLQLNKVLTGTSQTLFVDDNDSSGFMGEAGRMKGLTMSATANDKLVVKNFADTVFGSASSGQWYMELDLSGWTTASNSRVTDTGFGEFNSWKASAISSNQAISSATQLVGTHNEAGRSLASMKFNNTGGIMYSGGKGYAGPANISYTLVDSSSTRLSLTLSAMTLSETSKNISLTKRWTVYPTGRIIGSFEITTTDFAMNDAQVRFFGRYNSGVSSTWAAATSTANGRWGMMDGDLDFHSLVGGVLSVKSAGATVTAPGSYIGSSIAASDNTGGADNSARRIQLLDALFEAADDAITVNFAVDISKDFTDSATADSLLKDLQTPATITAITGTATTNDALDFNADGFAEGDGAYTYTASGTGVAHFKLVNTVTHFNPAFRIKSWSFATLPEFISVDNQTLTLGYHYNAYVNTAASELVLQLNRTFSPGTHVFFLSHKTGLAVSLNHFEAVAGEGVDTLRWATESEFENLGFNLWRRVAPVQATGPGLTGVAGSLPDSLFSGVGKVAGAGIANALLEKARAQAAAKVAQGGGDTASDTLPEMSLTPEALKALGYVRINAKLIPGAKGGSSATTSRYEFIDRTAGFGTTYQYLLEAVDFSGTRLQYGPRSATPLNPLETALESNYPNPFNPITTLRFSLKEKAKVSLIVYDAKGRMVRALIRPDKALLPGKYRLIWDARDDRGFEVPSGQYFYRFTAPKYHKTRKMILVK